MAETQSYATLLNAVTTTQTTAATATSGLYAKTVFCQLVVVGTPTGSAAFAVLESLDNVVYYQGPSFAAPLVASTYWWKIALDPTTAYVKVAFVAQTGGTSGTFTAQLGEVTGV